MKISNFSEYIKALIEVEAEGYFVERLINLCRINNIKIWDVVYINNGKITFKMSSKEFKKLKPYAKRSRCKIRIKSKRGVYFDIFKYRKRRILIYLSAILFVMFFAISSFVWNIEIVGSGGVDKVRIEQLIKDSGVHKGKLKYLISKGKIADYIRANLYEVAWVGVDIKGTTMTIELKEKVISKEEDKNACGNIVATKSAVISKIIADNGTAVYKTGSYINKGEVAIKGVIESEYIEPQYVHASGILRGIVEYNFEKEYSYKEKIKEFTGKSRFGFGAGINNKEIIIKYLPKEFKYDITNSTKKLNIFGVSFSFVFNKYEEYIIKEILNTKDTLIKKGEQDMDLFLNQILKSDSKIESKNVEIVETKEGITYKVVIKVDENIGEFVKTGDK